MSTTALRRRGPVLLSALVLAAVAHSAIAAGQFTNGQAASVVLGQQDFLTNATIAPGAASLKVPTAVAVDAPGNIWVADSQNYRVLRFPAPPKNGQAATVVLGQPDLTSNAQNSGGRTASSLGGPNAIAMDAAGNLWVADGSANGRVLRYSPPFTNFMPASLVLGVPDFGSIPSAPSRNSMGRPGGGGPHGLAFDAGGNLWVADTDNHRVLRFDAPFSNGQPAAIVLGQADFTSTAAATPPTAGSLNQPRGLAVDAAGSLWVADSTNNRVLHYGPPFANGQAASLVIGQSRLDTNSAPNPPAASSLARPYGVTVHSSGSLWIADSNNRVLGYDPPFANGHPATTVIGQPDFVSNAAANPPTASSLTSSFGPVAFAGGQMWVADPFNHRVLAYAASSAPTPTPIPPDTATLHPMSPPDFPLKVTSEWGCAESVGGRCLRREIVRLCVGGQCFIPRPQPTPPPCVRCVLAGGLAAGAALGIIAAFLLRRRPKA